MPVWRTGGTIGQRIVPTNDAASGLWQCGEVDAARRDNIWPTTGDRYWDSVSLLLSADGANNSTTFTDSSVSPKTITRVGSPVISTTQSKFGGSSASLPTTADYLTVPASSAFAPGTGDFTLEGWFYQTTAPGSYGSPLWSQTSASFNYFILFAGTNAVTSARQLDFIATPSGGGTRITHPTTYALNTWHHFAVTRSSGNVQLWLNGAGSTPTSNTTNLNNTTLVPTIGRSVNGTLSYIGYLDEIRYTIGVARYTADFTPSTTAFPQRP